MVKFTCNQLGHNFLYFPKKEWTSIKKLLNNDDSIEWYHSYHGFVMAAISQQVISIDLKRERCASLDQSS